MENNCKIIKKKPVGTAILCIKLNSIQFNIKKVIKDSDEHNLLIKGTIDQEIL